MDLQATVDAIALKWPQIVSDKCVDDYSSAVMWCFMGANNVIIRINAVGLVMLWRNRVVNNLLPLQVVLQVGSDVFTTRGSDLRRFTVDLVSRCVTSMPRLLPGGPSSFKLLYLALASALL